MIVLFNCMQTIACPNIMGGVVSAIIGAFTIVWTIARGGGGAWSKSFFKAQA